MGYVEPTIENYIAYTSDDFTIEKSEQKYGPVWKIKLKNSDSKLTYVLRSTVLMKPPGGMKAPSGIHLDVSYSNDGNFHSGSWRGCYRTDDMEEAFEALIHNLNSNKMLEILEHETSDVIRTLSETLESLTQSFESFSHKNPDEIFESVCATFLALYTKFNSVREELESLDQ